MKIVEAPEAMRALAVRSVAGSALIERLAKPVFLVDAERRVELRNSSANRMLQRDDSPFRIRSGRLQALDEALHGIVSSACVSLARTRGPTRTADRFIPMPDGWSDNYYGLSLGRAHADNAHRTYGVGGHLILTVHPRSVRDTAPVALWEAVFGFTRAESRLALELWDGKSVAEAADFLGIAVSTVRSQLLSIFRKTRTARQPEMVRALGIVAEAAAVCGPP